MTNINRKIVESRDYRNLYRMELFNTGYVIVFRQTDDNSTGETKFIGRETDEGYTVALKITNFLEQYSTSMLEQIVDLFENFIQYAKITVDSNMNPIMFAYQHTNLNFLQQVLKNDNYSDVKKWCVLASAFQELPSFTAEKNSDFLFSVVEHQINPEEIKEWSSIQESTHYFYPNFPNNGKAAEPNPGNSIDVQYHLLVKSEQSYKDYITIINLLKNNSCKTLGEAKNLGFVNFNGNLTEDDTKTINFYLKRSAFFDEHPYLTLDDFYHLEKVLHKVPIRDNNSEVSQFVIQQVLSNNLSMTCELGNRGFFLSYDEYLEFIEIADASTMSLPKHSPLSRPSFLNVFDNRGAWDFWIMMAKLFSENDATIFSQFLNEWIELIDEETNEYSYKSFSLVNKMIKVSKIKEYFDMFIDSKIPVRYLWYLHGNIETSMD